MDTIKQLLQTQSQLINAQLSPDPTAIIENNPPEKARWIIWANGAGGLLSLDWISSAPWLESCYELLKNEDHKQDSMWLAEVWTALGEFSLKAGEYYDAINRSQKACKLWAGINLKLKEQVSYQNDYGNVQKLAEDYIKGELGVPLKESEEEKEELIILLYERSMSMLIDSIHVGLNAMSDSRTCSKPIYETAEKFLREEHLSRKERWGLYMSMGDVASNVNDAEEALYCFENAVNLYYQACNDLNDLYLLSKALFNKANTLSQLGKYDEAINIHQMIAGNFEECGNYEGELRLDYAIAHARYLKGDQGCLEDELRRLIEAYHIQEKEAHAYRQSFDPRNLGQVYCLLLTVIASKASSAEGFLEGL